MKRVLDFFVNREWAVAIGVATTVVMAVNDLLVDASDTATTIAGSDLDVLSFLPVVAAFLVRLRVWSAKTVDEIRGGLDGAP